MLVYGKNPTEDGAALAEERTELPEGPPAAGAARRSVEDVFQRWGWAAEAPSAALAVSELVGDLCTEATAGLQLILRRRDDHVRILVRGRGEGCRFHRLTGHDADTARSFAVIDALVPLWGVVPRADGDSVWLDVPREA